MFARASHGPCPLQTIVQTGLSLGILLGLLQLSSAQERPRTSPYGRGVLLCQHGQYWEAIEQLDLASHRDAHDARIYYWRGLAKLRSGQLGAGEADLALAAQLEIQHPRRDIGTALQRVQGAERLTIERYRKEAKLLASQFPAAPSPPTATERATDDASQDTAETAPSDRAVQTKPRVRKVPTFRLPELPQDASDPFATDANGFLGRGELQAAASPAPEEESSTDPLDEMANDDARGGEPQDEQTPVGSGVADGTLDADGDDTSASSRASVPSGEKKRGVLGAVFRALTRSAVPAENLARQGQAIISGRGPASLPPGMNPSPPSDEGVPADEEDAASEPAGEAGDDPFADEPASGDADGAAESGDAADDSATEEDLF